MLTEEIIGDGRFTSPGCRLCPPPLEWTKTIRAQVPLASRALIHDSKEVRLVGLRLTALVSTTAESRETAMRYGLLEHITSTEDYDNDERECCCWTNKK